MKLTVEKVKRIKKLLKKGVTQPKIAAHFGVSRSLISDIATGRVWTKVGGKVPNKRQGGQHKVVDYDPTDSRVLSLESEIVMLQEERQAMRRQIKAMSKARGLFQAIVDEMEKVVTPMEALPKFIPVASSKMCVEEHLVMHLSDGHHDQIVLPSDCGGLENYNFLVSMRRAEQYVDTVLKWTQTLAPQFRFPVLTVLAYGDHTSGEIHSHAERSYFRNQFKNCFAIGQLHALMFRDLEPYFDAINVVYVPGNHGRRSLTKNYHGAHDNWDYLIAETARLHCSDIPSIHFTIPDSFSINLDINGVGFCIFHGDDIRSNLGIPFYGLERRQQRIMALNQALGTRIRYFCCGHFHRPSSLTDIDGEIVVNGAWVATDAYAYNSFSGFSVPSQLLHGVDPKYGITWRLPVHLRTDDEANGPQRYQIDLAKEVRIL